MIELIAMAYPICRMTYFIGALKFREITVSTYYYFLAIESEPTASDFKFFDKLDFKNV